MVIEAPTIQQLKDNQLLSQTLFQVAITKDYGIEFGMPCFCPQKNATDKKKDRCLWQVLLYKENDVNGSYIL